MHIIICYPVLKLLKEIEAHPSNKAFTNQGWEPLFSVSSTSKIIVIGQAPGIRAQTSGIPWDDKSGERLRSWLGVTKEQFYNEDIVALIPKDFYYPGKGKSGDLAPRKDFAGLWHQKILKHVEGEPLVVLIGMYAQEYYLKNKKRTLKETVRSFQEYVDDRYIPLPHPSPRNNIWMAKHEWFEEDVLPVLRKEVQIRLKSM